MSLAKIFLRTSLFIFALSFSALAIASFATSILFYRFAVNEYELPEALVDIPFGTSQKGVSLILEKAGVVSNATIFYWYLRLGRRDGDRIQAGFYHFSGRANLRNVADRLLFGRDRAYAITFKEGQTLLDLAISLEMAGLVKKTEFLAAMTDEEILSIVGAPHAHLRQGLENDVGGIEGYLYPDTYFFTKKDSPKQILRRMHQRLLELLTDDILARMKETGKSLHEVLTMASIIEKETAHPMERPMIASVYSNRLIKGMRLQADPTVIYGMKDQRKRIGKADLLSFHPYNTYKIHGLPPGPISSVGLPSIKAALWPVKSQFYYFVSRNDGSHVFCEDLNCHNAAVKKWQIDYFSARP